jgi:hypothetical protein
MFGKLLAHHPEPFVNQSAFATVEIQSQVRWYADCTNCRALGSPGLAKGGGPQQFNREPGALSPKASKCVEDDRLIVRLQQFDRSVSGPTDSNRSVSICSVSNCPVFDRATSACASSAFACADSRVIVRARHFFPQLPVLRHAQIVKRGIVLLSCVQLCVV